MKTVLRAKRLLPNANAASPAFVRWFLCLVGYVSIGFFLSAPCWGQYQSETSQASRSSNVTLDYEGFTEPKYDLMVAAVEIGRINEVLVRVGDRVKRGQAIARLEDLVEREALATAKWRAQMHGETDAAKAEASLAKLRLDQLQTLAEKQMARPDELKRALADWEVARSRELAAREQDQLRQLELARVQLQLERRNVTAPMDGVVADVFHFPGEYVTPADPAVIRLVVIDQLSAVFNVPAAESSNIRVGREASVYLNSSRVSVTGTVSSVSPEIDGESGTVRVKVLLDNRNGKLRAGDRCRMKLLPERAPSRPARSSLLWNRFQGSKTKEAAAIR